MSFCISFVHVFHLHGWGALLLDWAFYFIVLENKVIGSRLFWGPMQVKIQLLDNKLANSLAERFRSLFSMLLPLFANVVNSTWDSLDLLVVSLLIVVILIRCVVELVLDRLI